jgi:hypothetical protein
MLRKRKEPKKSIAMTLMRDVQGSAAESPHVREDARGRWVCKRGPGRARQGGEDDPHVCGDGERERGTEVSDEVPEVRSGNGP